MSSFISRNVVEPLSNALSQGLSPHSIALSLSCGIVGGIFPIPLTTALICFIFIYLFQLNVAICQVVNLLVTPLQFILIVPFLRLGEALLLVNEPFPLSAEELSQHFSQSITGALSKFGEALLISCFGWAVSAAFAIPLIYFMIYLILKVFGFTKNTTTQEKKQQ
jgi:uncharacterized protein (DUF2062 family)